jgi:hypothetical protein
VKAKPVGPHGPHGGTSVLLAPGERDLRPWSRSGLLSAVAYHALDVLPGAALTVLVVMRARCEPGTGFDVVLDVVEAAAQLLAAYGIPPPGPAWSALPPRPPPPRLNWAARS